MKKQVVKKKPVYFIAIKYKDNPAEVSYFTKEDGKEIPAGAVKKEHTNAGTALYTTITTSQ